MSYFHPDYEMKQEYKGFAIYWHATSPKGQPVYLESTRLIPGLRCVSQHTTIAAAKQKARRVLAGIEKAKARNRAYIGCSANP